MNKLSGSKGPWISLTSGGIAGYLVMVRDKSQPKLKKQINMAIGIRTLYAVAAYLVRTGNVPGIGADAAGYQLGTSIWYVALWSIVMWHWRHQTASAPGEMNVAQVKQMDFIYTGGDRPQWGKWWEGGYVYWLFALSIILAKERMS